MSRFDEKTVFDAFDTLGDGEHSSARAAYEFAEKQLKVVLAKAEIASNGKTVGERQASALASPEYARALHDFQLIARTYYRARDRREAASAIIDGWRTQQSDNRAQGKIG
jgi:hypothetical protein